MTRSDLIRLRDMIEAGDDVYWQFAKVWPPFEGPARVLQKGLSAISGSVDAAIAFTEAVLPGWTWTAGVNAYHGYSSAFVRRLSDAGDRIEGDFGATSKTPATALVLAALAALIERTPE